MHPVLPNAVADPDEPVAVGAAAEPAQDVQDAAQDEVEPAEPASPWTPGKAAPRSPGRVQSPNWIPCARGSSPL